MDSKRIVVVGTMASDPYAGMAWMHMQIAMGLKRLGHDVYYFETTNVWPYNPVIQSRVDNPDYAVSYLKRVTESFGLGDKWAYRCSFSKHKEWFGMPGKNAEELLAHADLVLNISGSTVFKPEGLKTGRLIFWGTDPVFPEIKYSQGDPGMRSVVDEHQDVITYGENIGNPDCPIPPLPRLKARTRQPVLLDLWKCGEPSGKEFTTVGNWKQSGRDVEFRGEKYCWSKHHEFLKYIDLPKKTGQSLEVAMNLGSLEEIKPDLFSVVPSLGLARDEYTLLVSNGWKLVDGPSFTNDPWPYRDYIIHSRGEFSFAKDQNIRLRSGWFSERSACYLAAGRPVITQDTGFGCTLPVGNGLFACNNLEDMISAFDQINGNYQKHSKAAREIAEEYFRAETVLQKVLNDLNV